MVQALGHDVPRIFTLVFAGGTALAGLAGVIGGNALVTEPGMADAVGSIVFVVVVVEASGRSPVRSSPRSSSVSCRPSWSG